MAYVFEYYYFHPNTFLSVIVLYALYGLYHQYKSDLILKQNNIKLNFGTRLVAFRIPVPNKTEISEQIWLDIRKLAKEYSIATLIFLLYFLVGIIFDVVNLYQLSNQ